MNVKEFKEWLDHFDDDTVVEVMIQQEPSIYQAYGECVATEFKGLEYDDHDYSDFTGNPYVNPDAPYYNKKFLTLGVSS